MTHLNTIRTAFEGKSPLIAALFSGSLGLGAEGFGAGNSGGLNTIAIVALCGATGAFFSSLPRIIAAMSGADASARSLLSKELRSLLNRIRRLDQRVVLEQDSKHIVQSEHNNLAVHIGNLRELLRQAGGTVPEFRIRTYEEMLGPNNKEIKALMLLEEEEA